MGSGNGVQCIAHAGRHVEGRLTSWAEGLPSDPAERDDLLLRIMGSPDARQIDGIGGAHPLTSKVAVISPSARADADVDYLFLQVGVEAAVVCVMNNCAISENIIDEEKPNAMIEMAVRKSPNVSVWRSPRGVPDRHASIIAPITAPMPCAPIRMP